jgi:hypothetical protein
MIHVMRPGQDFFRAVLTFKSELHPKQVSPHRARVGTPDDTGDRGVAGAYTFLSP